MEIRCHLALLLLTTLVSWSNRGVRGQGTGSSVPLSDDELDKLEKERTKNVVRLAATDQLNSEIITNRTRAYLNCESGEMVVKINFSQPFRGVAYSDYDRSSPCKFYGDGRKYYELRLPLKGCGTKQEAPRLFINNIIVRFHRSLELEEDEIKTIICRYPPPQAPPPPSVVAPILEQPVPVPIVIPAKLSEIELLLIICALLFLTLLLLGIGMAYYCLKRRNIKLIRKKRTFSAAPSEITKLSHSTLFDQIRIPRAIAHSSSSDTIPSDYPSSDSDERRTIVSETSTIRNEHFRYENAAYIPEPYPVDHDRDGSVASVPLPVAHMPNITTANYTETMVTKEDIIDEDVVDTTHKKTMARLYKKLGSPQAPPSIPDNDNRSDNETEVSVPQALAWKTQETLLDHDWSYSEVDETTSVRIPRVTSLTTDETHVRRDNLTDEDETVTNQRATKTIQTVKPKITLHKMDDLFVTNIIEKNITEQNVQEKSGLVDVTSASAGFITSSNQISGNRISGQITSDTRTTTERRDNGDTYRSEQMRGNQERKLSTMTVDNAYAYQDDSYDRRVQLRTATGNMATGSSSMMTTTSRVARDAYESDYDGINGMSEQTVYMSSPARTMERGHFQSANYMTTSSGDNDTYTANYTDDRQGPLVSGQGLSGLTMVTNSYVSRHDTALPAPSGGRRRGSREEISAISSYNDFDTNSNRAHLEQNSTTVNSSSMQSRNVQSFSANVQSSSSSHMQSSRTVQGQNRRIDYDY
ncbi:hypothetical protein HDE_01486 [Halotydeus destructor]|nr:hypothetical protein HDE_01486 [Halotydeus destructor]